MKRNLFPFIKPATSHTVDRNGTYRGSIDVIIVVDVSDSHLKMGHTKEGLAYRFILINGSDEILQGEMGDQNPPSQPPADHGARKGLQWLDRVRRSCYRDRKLEQTEYPTIYRLLNMKILLNSAILFTLISTTFCQAAALKPHDLDRQAAKGIQYR